MSLAQEFMDAAESLLRRIRETQLERIMEAGQLIADALAAGGALHYFDTGHCTEELLHRAGGLFAINPIQVNLSVSHPLPPPCRDQEQPELADFYRRHQDESILPFVLANCHFRPGDVLLIHSVSGRNALPVGLALGAKEKGIRVVAITSRAYSQAVEPNHSSGKKLYELADIAIDSCVPVGDAILQVDGLDTGACPSSGLAFVYIAWSLIAQVIEELLRRGIKPHVYRSVNLPDGREFNRRAQREYERTGL